jgi:CheY-like chemotaxis protein
MSELRKCVLIVDDEFLIATLWSILVQNMGLEVCGIAATADEAVALAKEHRPAVVLMDVRLRGVRDGVDAALEIHESLGSKMIFVTGSSEPRTRARIELDHPTATLFKPVSDRQLRGAIEDALQI